MKWQWNNTWEQKIEPASLDCSWTSVDIPPYVLLPRNSMRMISDRFGYLVYKYGVFPYIIATNISSKSTSTPVFNFQVSFPITPYLTNVNLNKSMSSYFPFIIRQGKWKQYWSGKYCFYWCGIFYAMPKLQTTVKLIHVQHQLTTPFAFTL